MSMVWAFRPLPELGGAVGCFVYCDEDVAERLIAEDLVDDPRIGAAFLREPVQAATRSQEPDTPTGAPRETPAQSYGTRDLLPTRSDLTPNESAETTAKRKPGRPRKHPLKAPR